MGISIAGHERWIRLAVLVGVAVLLHLVGQFFAHLFDFQIFPRHEPMLHMVVLSAAAAYVLLMAVPFMPGIEVGLAILLLLGGQGALLVYLCTVSALALSYGLGRLMPGDTVSRLLYWLRFQKAAELARRVEVSPVEKRGDVLYGQLSGRFLPFLLRHRYLAVAVLVNLPGNAVIGGGGGIGMLVGMSRLMPFLAYLCTIALAVAPVPLAFFLLGR